MPDWKVGPVCQILVRLVGQTYCDSTIVRTPAIEQYHESTIVRTPAFEAIFANIELQQSEDERHVNAFT